MSELKSVESPKSTAMVPAVPIMSAMTMPAEGTPERARFAQAAADMTDVLAAYENNPRAIVLWHGTERCVADLVRAWRKLAIEAERSRMTAKAK